MADESSIDDLEAMQGRDISMPMDLTRDASGLHSLSVYFPVSECDGEPGTVLFRTISKDGDDCIQALRHVRSNGLLDLAYSVEERRLLGTKEAGDDRATAAFRRALMAAAGLAPKTTATHGSVDEATAKKIAEGIKRAKSSVDGHASSRCATEITGRNGDGMSTFWKSHPHPDLKGEGWRYFAVREGSTHWFINEFPNECCGGESECFLSFLLERADSPDMAMRHFIFIREQAAAVMGQGDA